MRRFGYALWGKSPIQHGILHKGGRISAIAAIASTGAVAVDMTTGSVNGEVFFDFVRTLLIPQILPFDGENACSIVVLDNCSIHHVQHVIDLFVAAGILVLFLFLMAQTICQLKRHLAMLSTTIRNMLTYGSCRMTLNP